MTPGQDPSHERKAACSPHVMEQMPQTQRSLGLENEQASLRQEHRRSSKDRQRAKELGQEPRPRIAHHRKDQYRHQPRHQA
ncbi:hypothetical protein HanRHA438_Chr04g0168181 [Helianthus annuus]|nr:hypothetical protein HanRHA438_Chr04g0168181 [Helianthus annuus]